MAIRPVEQLILLARQGPRLALPIETCQAYPVPVRRPAGLCLAFLYAPSHSVPEGRYLSAPTYVAHLSGGGKLEQMSQVGPPDFGQPQDRADVRIRDMPSEGMTRDEYMAGQRELYGCYDLLLPAFAADRTTVHADVRAAAARFKTLFARLAEPSLRPYHLSLGKDFFAWLDRVAR